MQDAALTLVTLNVWGRTGPWTDRRTLIRSELERLVPDIVALQEVWEDADGNLVDELLDRDTWHVHYAPAFELAPGRTCGNAIASRYPLGEHGAWPLADAPGDLARNLVYARVDTPWGAVPVFTTHLAWRFHHGPYRFAQVQELAARVAATAPIQRGDQPTPVLPAVVLGDFNADPDADEIRYLRGLTANPGGVYFTDAFGARGDGPGYTWHRDNEFAARERTPDRRIDYVFVRGPDRWNRGEVLSARVAFEIPVGGMHASDHYGVVAAIRATPVELPPL